MADNRRLEVIERRFFYRYGVLFCRAHRRKHCQACYEKTRKDETSPLIIETVKTDSTVRLLIRGVLIPLAIALTLTLVGIFQ